MLLQLDRPAPRAAVEVEAGLVDAASDIDLGQAIAVAVKRSDTATHLEFVVTFETALQAGTVGLLDEARDNQRVGRMGAGQGQCDQEPATGTLHVSYSLAPRATADA